MKKFENIGNQLQGYTEKLVFSFADIAAYKKVKSNLEKNQIHYTEWTENQMNEFAKNLSELNRKWNFQLATCGEKINLAQYGIAHNKCVDDELMIRFAKNDSVLMDFLGVEVTNSLFDGEQIVRKKDNKDKGQRAFCGCVVSKDIGEYNTCPHLCEYCYANASKELAVKNYKVHLQNPEGETITGK